MDPFQTLTYLHTSLCQKINDHPSAMQLDDSHDDVYTMSDMVLDLVNTCYHLHKENENYDKYLSYALALYADIQWRK